MPTLNQTLMALFGSEPVRTTFVSGGDINHARCLEMKDGTQVFMKSNSFAAPDFFRAEADGLAAIERTEAIRVPHVLAMGQDETVGSYLLLEWIESAPRVRGYWQDFGHALAQMHRAQAGGKFGWKTDNYIGSRRQINRTRDSWVTFFRDCRLAPQFRDADSWFDREDRRRFTRLLDHLDEHLAEPPFPSLVHGDLWSGNFITGPDGAAWLIDPAIHIGHGEADLAMTELFGGFSPEFYAAYREVNPLQAGYERRRDLYNLYHLLNHLNLFGGGYLGSVRQVLRRYT